MLKIDLAKHSRCLVRLVPSASFEQTIATSIWALATTGDDRRLWERLYADDHVILIDSNSFRLLAGIVEARSVDLTAPKSEQPLRLALNIKGIATSSTIPLHGYNSRTDLFCPAGEFIDLWQKCEPARLNRPKPFSDFFFQKGGIAVRCASTQRDLNYVEQFAEDHSFGYRTAFLTLIATQNGEPIGALLAQPCLANRYPHPATVKVFGSDYEHFRHDSLSIKRIYSSKTFPRKLELQEVLLLALADIGPFLVQGTLRIIEGVSYDFLPLNEKLGFHAEIPQKSTDSIYYWKAFGLPDGYVAKRALAPDASKSAAHTLHTAKASQTYYCAFVRPQDLVRSKAESGWALTETKENKGLWKSLRRGDVIFYLRDRRWIDGFASVVDTKYVAQMRSFPLGIRLEAIHQPKDPVDLLSDLFRNRIDIPHSGGIFALDSRVAAEVKFIFEKKERKNQMWITPNQSILSGTDFQTIPKQVFVVQAWSLKENVLPIIRSVLTKNHYSVTHADDRQGEVVFQDIWKLLNEAEVVLVDFTEKRPNVYLEYGMALVLGKPIVAISQDLADIPSDTPQLKVIKYENTMTGTTSLESRIVTALADRIRDMRAKAALQR